MVDEHMLRVDLITEFGDPGGHPMRLPQKIRLTVQRLSAQSGDGPFDRGGDKPGDTRIASRDSAVRTRTELEQPPFETGVLDPLSQTLARRYNDVPAVLFRSFGEDRQRAVVRREVRTEDEQAHLDAIAGR